MQLDKRNIGLLLSVLTGIIVGSHTVSTIATAQAPAGEFGFTQRENIVYHEAHGICFVMDIFVPTSEPNGRGIVDVISGAWHSDRNKIRDHLRAQTFPILCRKGYTVFAIRPGSITKFSGLEMLEHLNHGIVWVKQHATDFQIDPDRLGLMGASAGGHLACLATVTAQATQAGAANPGTQVAATAVFFPPTDFLNFGGTDRNIDVQADGDMSQILRRLAFARDDQFRVASADDIRQAIVRVSPAQLVKAGLPPFLLIHGDADPVVPLQQSELMVAELQKAGVSAELIVKPGGGHPWLTLPFEVQRMADWFDTKLLDASANDGQR